MNKTIIIVGGGAAGMMAAISASGDKNKVILLERNEKLGKKLFITGKGRCNLTNACDQSEFLQNIPTNSKFLYSSFHSFTNEDMMKFMEEEGCKLKTERGGRVFPLSDKSSDVIKTLQRACENRHVSIRLNAKVQDILLNKEGKFIGVRLADGREFTGDALILAAGGRSYTSTGSDGDAYRLAESIGHKIKTPYPSLVPFVMEEDWCKTLMGLALKNVSIKVKAGKKMVFEGMGEFLFTHFGVSGPLVLTASTRLGSFQKQLEAGELRLLLDLKPALTVDQLDARFLREFDTYRNKNVGNVIERMLPKKMVPIFLELAGIEEEKKVRDINKKERRRMVELMKNIEMKIKGVRGFEEAIVTRGGVNVKEVNPSTMESKKVPEIYFAGEMLDVDAVTGGFNLQIAWSTGYVAGQNAGR